MTGVQQSSVASDNHDTLAPVLRAAHRIWIRETDRFLLPIMVPEAQFWERWTAVRYLADEFLGQYRRERAIIDEVHLFLPPETAARLIQDGESIGWLQGGRDRGGRGGGAGDRGSGLGGE